MKTFKDYITEALDPDDYLERQSTPAELFIGRMQPFHIGHSDIINKMKNPVVALVKGAATSKNKEMNPLNAKYQTRLINKANPKAEVIIVPNGYIPDIVTQMRKDGNEVSKIYAGEDRISTYRQQIASYNKQMPADKQIKVKFVKTTRTQSATDVRAAIRDDDEELFRTMMPKSLHSEYKTLRKQIHDKF